MDLSRVLLDYRLMGVVDALREAPPEERDALLLHAFRQILTDSGVDHPEQFPADDHDHRVLAVWRLIVETGTFGVSE